MSKSIYRHVFRYSESLHRGVRLLRHNNSLKLFILLAILKFKEVKIPIELWQRKENHK